MKIGEKNWAISETLNLYQKQIVVRPLVQGLTINPLCLAMCVATDESETTKQSSTLKTKYPKEI